MSSSQLKEDFRLLERALTETHPGLYRYTSKENMSGKMDSIKKILEKPMPFYDFYRIIASLISDIRCAHTHALPNGNFHGYMGRINTLPFFIYPVAGRLYVIFNGSSDRHVTLGYQLTRINGRPIEYVITEIKKHYWTDGYIETAKNTALQGGLFCLLYYGIIERPASFELVFKDLNGNDYHTTVPAQRYGLTERAYVKGKLNKKANRFYNQRHKKPWRLSFPEDIPKTALLRFDAFGGKNVNTSEEAAAAMRSFMDESLRKIGRRECTNLIIDVRSNSGGWDAQGVELFTYLMKQDTAVQYYERMHTITDSSEFFAYSDLGNDDKKNIKKELRKETDGTYSLREEFNETLRPQSPKPNRFKGNVYILQNERSFSTTAEFLAACKTYEVATRVGMEAGGAYEGGNGGSFLQIDLPYSKIRVGTPLIYYDNATRNGYPRGRGTLPDHCVEVQPDDLITNYDRQLAFVKRLIKKTD